MSDGGYIANQSQSQFLGGRYISTGIITIGIYIENRIIKTLYLVNTLYDSHK